MLARRRDTTGVRQLDTMLGGVRPGDNLVLHAHPGAGAFYFAREFVRSSLARKIPTYYVCFADPPRSLIQRLGKCADGELLTIVDCFTSGRGEGEAMFERFYETAPDRAGCSVERFDNPADPEAFARRMKEIEDAAGGGIHFVFDSSACMQELWKSEEAALRFFSSQCPRLLELGETAYWCMERGAHTDKYLSRVSHITQIVIELSFEDGVSMMTIVKADGRQTPHIAQAHPYRIARKRISFTAPERRQLPDLGRRVRELRMETGLSQSDLARAIGVTPSNISQLESDTILPSVPALLRLARALGVSTSVLLGEQPTGRREVLSAAANWQEVPIGAPLEGALRCLSPAPFDPTSPIQVRLLEMRPGASIGQHFAGHRGEEMVYVISGRVELDLDDAKVSAGPGDLLTLSAQQARGWRNPRLEPARLLWVFRR